MASEHSIPPSIPPINGTTQITVSDDGTDLLLNITVRLTADAALDLMLRMLGTVGRLKKVAAP